MNKILVSIVLAVILVVGINKVTDLIFYVEKPEKSAYQVESVTSVAKTTSSETSSEVGVPLLVIRPIEVCMDHRNWLVF